MRFAFLVALLLLAPLAPPSVSGGSEQSPEITDESHDVDVVSGGGLRTTVGAAEIDIVKAWFESNATTVSVFWEVLHASHRLQSDEGRGFSMVCKSGTDTVSMDANAFPDDSAPWVSSGVTVYHADGTSSSMQAGVVGSESGNLIRLDMPRSLFAASTCVEPKASSIISFHTGPGTWQTLPCCVVSFADVAPDTGYGRDAQFN